MRERGRSLGVLDWMGTGAGSGTLQNRLRRGSVNKKKYNQSAADPTEPKWEGGPRGEWGEAEEMEEKETLKKEGQGKETTTGAKTRRGGSGGCCGWRQGGDP